MLTRAKYYRKHILRHTKPFTCPKEGCARREGFSTSNDLERHMKSKHPDDFPMDRLSDFYRCPINGCRFKDKRFPRLDNFRSHLKRVHHLLPDHVEEIARRSVFIVPRGRILLI